MESNQDILVKLDAVRRKTKHEAQKYEDLRNHLALCRQCAKLLDSVKRSKRMYEDIARGGIQYWDASRTAGTGYEKLL